MSAAASDTVSLVRAAHDVVLAAARDASANPSSFDPDRLDARSPELVARLTPIAGALNRHYLRLVARGFEDLPRQPVVYVGNHNGGIAGPDLSCTLASLWSALGPSHPLHALAHDFVMRQVPRAGAVLQRFGAVRAKPETALRALAAGGQVLVYPGGDLDAYRHARRRDRIVLGTRTGFVRVAGAARAPIVPIVAHGAHRSAYIFSEGEAIARFFGLKKRARLERFPLAFALPWGVALGPWLPYVPLPFQVRLRLLAPIEAHGHSPESVREEVRRVMQVALDEMAEEARTRTRHDGVDA